MYLYYTHKLLSPTQPRQVIQAGPLVCVSQLAHTYTATI